MTDTPVQIEYSEELDALADLLAKVDRPGGFVVSGDWTGPLPRVDVDGMDMTHETERRGRPYTLVCMKTRRSYEGLLARYRQDIEAMTFMRRHVPAGAEEMSSCVAAAIALAGEVNDG